MEIINLLIETITSALLSIGRLALFLIPILILIEIARFYQVIEKITGKFKGVMNFLTLPQEAALPLIAGLIFGIVFGAALIIEYSREGYLKKRDFLLLGVFLSISHSIIEDTIIFTVLGANALIVLGIRIFMALAITKIAAYFLKHSTSK